MALNYNNDPTNLYNYLNIKPSTQNLIAKGNAAGAAASQQTGIPFVPVNQPVATPTIQAAQTTPAFLTGIPSATASNTTLASLLGDQNQFNPVDQANKDYQTSLAPIDYSTVKEKAISALQAQIDATNNYWDQQVARVQQEQARQAKARLGVNTSIQARSGQLGSSFGEASTASLQEANKQAEEAAVSAEEEKRRNAIQGLTNTATNFGIKEAEARRQASIEGAQAKVNEILNRQNRLSANADQVANSAILKGIDLSNVSQSDLATIASNSGIAISSLLSSYKKAKEANDKILADQTKVAAENAKLAAETALIGKPKPMTEYEAAKFNEDKRQFGLEYALKAQKAVSDNITTSIKPTEQYNQLEFLKNTVDDASKVAAAAGRSGLRKTAEGFLIGSTDYTQLGSYLDTLKTNLLTLATDPTIKKFFGPQMSNADVRLMQSAASTLNPENKPEVVQKELMRVKEVFTRLQNAIPREFSQGALPVARILQNQLPANQSNASSILDKYGVQY